MDSQVSEAFEYEDDGFIAQDDANLEVDSDEYDAVIETELAKFHEQQAVKYAQLQATSVWVALPLPSPDPVKQHVKSEERQQLARLPDDSLGAHERSEYVPPPRPPALQQHLEGPFPAAVPPPDTLQRPTSAAPAPAYPDSTADVFGTSADEGLGLVSDAGNAAEWPGDANETEQRDSPEQEEVYAYQPMDVEADASPASESSQHSAGFYGAEAYSPAEDVHETAEGSTPADIELPDAESKQLQAAAEDSMAGSPPAQPPSPDSAAPAEVFAALSNKEQQSTDAAAAPNTHRMSNAAVAEADCDLESADSLEPEQPAVAHTPSSFFLDHAEPVPLQDTEPEYQADNPHHMQEQHTVQDTHSTSTEGQAEPAAVAHIQQLNTDVAVPGTTKTHSSAGDPDSVHADVHPPAAEPAAAASASQQVQQFSDFSDPAADDAAYQGLQEAEHLDQQQQGDQQPQIATGAEVGDPLDHGWQRQAQPAEDSVQASTTTMAPGLSQHPSEQQLQDDAGPVHSFQHIAGFAAPADQQLPGDPGLAADVDEQQPLLPPEKEDSAAQAEKQHSELQAQQEDDGRLASQPDSPGSAELASEQVNTWLPLQDEQNTPAGDVALTGEQLEQLQPLGSQRSGLHQQEDQLEHLMLQQHSQDAAEAPATQLQQPVEPEGSDVQQQEHGQHSQQQQDDALVEHQESAQIGADLDLEQQQLLPAETQYSDTQLQQGQQYEEQQEQQQVVDTVSANEQEPLLRESQGAGLESTDLQQEEQHQLLLEASEGSQRGLLLLQLQEQQHGALSGQVSSTEQGSMGSVGQPGPQHHLDQLPDWEQQELHDGQSTAVAGEVLEQQSNPEAAEAVGYSLLQEQDEDQLLHPHQQTPDSEGSTAGERSFDQQSEPAQEPQQHPTTELVHVQPSARLSNRHTGPAEPAALPQECSSMLSCAPDTVQHDSKQPHHQQQATFGGTTADQEPLLGSGASNEKFSNAACDAQPVQPWSEFEYAAEQETAPADHPGAVHQLEGDASYSSSHGGSTTAAAAESQFHREGSCSPDGPAVDGDDGFIYQDEDADSSSGSSPETPQAAAAAAAMGSGLGIRSLVGAELYPEMQQQHMQGAAAGSTAAANWHAGNQREVAWPDGSMQSFGSGGAPAAAASPGQSSQYSTPHSNRPMHSKTRPAATPSPTFMARYAGLVDTSSDASPAGYIAGPRLRPESAPARRALSPTSRHSSYVPEGYGAGFGKPAWVPGGATATEQQMMQTYRQQAAAWGYGSIGSSMQLPARPHTSHGIVRGRDAGLSPSRRPAWVQPTGEPLRGAAWSGSSSSPSRVMGRPASAERGPRGVAAGQLGAQQQQQQQWLAGARVRPGSAELFRPGQILQGSSKASSSFQQQRQPGSPASSTCRAGNRPGSAGRMRYSEIESLGEVYGFESRQQGAGDDVCSGHWQQQQQEHRPRSQSRAPPGVIAWDDSPIPLNTPNSMPIAASTQSYEVLLVAKANSRGTGHSALCSTAAGHSALLARPRTAGSVESGAIRDYSGYTPRTEQYGSPIAAGRSACSSAVGSGNNVYMADLLQKIRQANSNCRKLGIGKQYRLGKGSNVTWQQQQVVIEQWVLIEGDPADEQPQYGQAGEQQYSWQLKSCLSLLQFNKHWDRLAAKLAEAERAAATPATPAEVLLMDSQHSSRPGTASPESLAAIPENQVADAAGNQSGRQVWVAAADAGDGSPRAQSARTVSTSRPQSARTVSTSRLSPRSRLLQQQQEQEYQQQLAGRVADDSGPESSRMLRESGLRGPKGSSMLPYAVPAWMEDYL